YEEGHFRLIFHPECYCDYNALEEELERNTVELSADFYRIVDRGQFLMGVDDPMFDQFKRDLENQLVNVIEGDLKKQLLINDYARVVQTGESLLNIDPINENALEKTLFALLLQKNEPKAKRIYLRFIEQYELTMGEKFRQPFEDFWRTI